MSDRIISDVKREFDVGAWDVGCMRFKETQMANYEIRIDMEHYKHELQQILKFRSQAKPNLKGCCQQKK